MRPSNHFPTAPGVGAAVARRARGALIVALAALLSTGCRDSVAPTAPLAPTVVSPLLAGATSIDLLAGQPEGTRADVRSINDAGQVTGSRILVSVNDWRPYRWTPSTGFETLSGICCGTAWGADINNTGEVVGRAETAVNQGPHAFVAVGTTMVDLGLLPGASLEYAWSDAVAVNDAGQIVGWAHTSAGKPHAVLWSAAHVIQDLGTLGGEASQAVDINGSGQVIGMSSVGPTERHAFLWSSGTGMQDLNAIIGHPVDPVAINDAGQITGSYTTPSGGSHAFLYTPGPGLRDLGTLGGDSSAATGLNAAGQVVGTSKLAGGGWHAFLWTPEGGMEDVTAATGFLSVHALNDDLQTLSSKLHSSILHPYILTLQVQQPAWPFTGFANPIGNPPAWNTLKAGHAAMLRFGLGGDRGLSIFVPGSPSSSAVSCANGVTIGAAAPVSPNDFELRYQAGPDRYTLRWKTDDAWSGSCRRLDLRLLDGSMHSALFSFR